MNVPLIETENYQLTQIKREDADELFSIMRDKETMKFITPHPVETKEQMRGKVAHYLTLLEEKKELPWTIFDLVNNCMVGVFRLHKLDNWHKKAEMNAVIRSEYQQQGVMTEVLPEILSYVFKTLKLNRLVGDIFAGNKGSEKLLLKYGFHRDGILRQTDFDGEKFHDTVVYSLLRAEYLTLQKEQIR
ncbi:GNAT family N-acetyltransferase [Alteribacter populi]|uniref:GNAT family N-acetyltransferase n=1 Tax=Alteribacter populi TaxID=2011011 RepID=UPI000BBB393A|nr:GNAT family N-acetyltransferase [Alteribacter populi]